MGQIRGQKAHIDACNLRRLSSFGIPAAGQHILVSTNNSATADGQGDFDAYVVGDGVTAATALPLHYTDGAYSGVIAEESVAGNGSSWRQQNLFDKSHIKAGDTLCIKLSGNITFAGTATTQVFLSLQVLNARGTNIKTLFSITGATAFEEKTFFYTATQECYIHVEGRWHTNEQLVFFATNKYLAQVEKNTTEIASKLNESVFTLTQRGNARVIYAPSINFNNTEHKVEIGGLVMASQSDNTRVSISATTIDYNFNAVSTSAVWLVRDLAQNAYSFVSAGTNTYNQVVIAGLKVSGNSSANPNTSKVTDVFWCPIRECLIDGKNGINPIISQYGEADYWVDGNKWTAKSANYAAIIIPISGASELVVTANAGYASRIAFANTYDPSTIVSGTTVINGTANQSTSAGQTRTLTIPSTCNYIVVNSRYGGNNSIPASLVIDGVEYCKGVQDALIDVSKTAHEAKNEADESATKANTAISILRGAAMVVNASSINFDNINHRVEMAGMSLANRSDGTRLTVAATNVNYNFNAASTTAYSFVYDFSDGTYKFISTGTQNINQVVIATLGISGNSSASPNTSKVTDVKWCAILHYYIDSANPAVAQAMYNSIIDRNIRMDAAVRAVGIKAVASDIKPFSFIHVSDIHTKADNYKCFNSACAFYEHYSNIKAMIATGDLVYDTFADAMTWYNIALQKTAKPVLNVIGNHDAGQYNSNIGLASQSSDKQCYDKYIAPYVDSWGVVQPSDAAADGKSYYYKDFVDEKIRLVVLNEFETDYEINSAGTGLVYSREFRAMRQAQVSWLIDTLGATPSDYGVIVAYHQPDNLAEEDNPFVSFDLVGSYRSSQGRDANIANVYCADKEWLPKILNAFATKSSLSLTVTQTGGVVTSSPTLVCDCDFTSVQAEFICILNGHTHRDYIGQLTNFPALKVLCVGADNLLYTSSFQPRAEGTPSEDLFNVVNIDRNRKTIKIIRIGSDASVTGQVREQMIMSYVSQSN